MAAAFTLAVFSRAGSLALAAAAVAVIVGFPHEGRPIREHRVMSDRAMEFLWSVLAVLVIPVGALLLLLQVGLLFFFAPPPPPNRLLAAMVVLEWVLAFSTCGAACTALAVAQLAVKLHAAGAPGPPGAYNVSVKHLAAAAMACVAAALAFVSALGMFWHRAAALRHRSGASQGHARTQH